MSPLANCAVPLHAGSQSQPFVVVRTLYRSCLRQPRDPGIQVLKSAGGETEPEYRCLSLKGADGYGGCDLGSGAAGEPRPPFVGPLIKSRFSELDSSAVF